MHRWIRYRALISVAALLAMTLLLSACDLGSLPDLGGGDADPPASGDPGEADASDDATDDATGGADDAGGDDAGGAGGADDAGGPDGSDGTGGGADGADGAGADGAPWRPFSDDSPWNRAIADDAALDPASDELISDFETSSPFGEALAINIPGFSIPLYYADAGTSTATVQCDIGGEGFESSDGRNATAEVPIPEGAEPDPESDHHLLIVDRERGIEWGMWNTTRSGDGWRCGVGATADLNGTGLRPYKPDNPTWYTSHGARACGFPLTAGLIRRDEIEAGSIDHALVVAYPHIRAGFYTSPASTAQARVGDDAIPTRGIPCGGRIQLDPDLDLDSLDLSRAGRIVAEALQRYGAYVGDYSGGINLYAENSPEAQEYWADGVLDVYELRDKIDLADFRVLEMGELTDDGNG